VVAVVAVVAVVVAVAVSFIATLWESPLERGVEGLALDLGDFKLKSAGLPAAVGGSVATCTPGRATVNLGEASELREGVGVAERDEDHAVVHKSGHDAEVGTLLTTTCAGSRNEGSHEFARKGTTLPKLTSGVPESLELSGPGAITGADTNEEAIVVRELGSGDNGVVRLRRRVHLRENLLRESLRDLVDRGRATLGFDTLLDRFGQLGDVAVHGVDNNGDVRSSHFA